MEPSLDLPLSQDNFLDVPCENDDVHDNTYIIPLQPLVKDHAICVLESNTCAENRYFFHTASDVDELNFLSFLNTLGYFEFIVLCDHSYLEEKLFAYADLPWLSRHKYHAFDKYNIKEDYMVHRIYICANLNSPFVVQHCDHIEDCNINNLVLPGASNFSSKTQVQSKEGEHMFLVSTILLQDGIDKDRVPYDRGAYKFAGIHTNWTHGHVSSWSFSFHYFGNPVCFRVVQNHFQTHSMPRTTFRQEGEDDKDMTSMETTTFGEWHRDQRDQHRFSNRDGGPKLIQFESPRWRPKSSSSPPWCRGPACTKNDAQAAYGVRFGRSLYG